MPNKVVGLLSICRKAGRLAMGFDAVCEAIRMSRAKLVVFTSDLSPGTRAKAVSEAERASPRPVCVDASLTMFDLSGVCGKLTGVVAVTDEGLAGRIETLLRTGA